MFDGSQTGGLSIPTFVALFDGAKGALDVSLCTGVMPRQLPALIGLVAQSTVTMPTVLLPTVTLNMVKFQIVLSTFLLSTIYYLQFNFRLYSIRFNPLQLHCQGCNFNFYRLWLSLIL